MNGAVFVLRAKASRRSDEKSGGPSSANQRVSVSFELSTATTNPLTILSYVVPETISLAIR